MNHPTPEQVKAHEDFRKELEKTYGSKDKPAAKKTAESPK